jgi:hypothetical protein
MAVEKLEGEVTWLDAKGGVLNIKDVKGSIHIIRAVPRKLIRIEKGNKVEVKLDGIWAKHIKRRLS